MIMSLKQRKIKFEPRIIIEPRHKQQRQLAGVFLQICRKHRNHTGNLVRCPQHTCRACRNCKGKNILLLYGVLPFAFERKEYHTRYLKALCDTLGVSF